MKSYSEFLPAGVPVKLTIGGRLLYIQRSSAGAVLDITFHNGAGTQAVSGVGKGFKAGPVGGFDTITFKAAAEGTIEFIVTDGDVNAQFDDASTIIGNDDGQAIPVRLKVGDRLPVDIGGGVVTVTAGDVAINNKCTTLTHFAVANVGTVAASVVNDATQKRLRFRNTHATAVVALGGAGVSIANAVVLLYPNEVWMEEDAPGVNWFAISDTANATLAIMGVK